MSRVAGREEIEVFDPQPSHYSAAQIRTALGYFLAGRFASAVLTFSTLLILLRGLSIPEYGVYVGLMATRGIVSILANLGLDAVGARYIPELRLHTGDSILRKSIIAMLAIRTGVLILTGLLMWIALPALGSILHIAPWQAIIPWFIALTIIGGISTFASGMLEALLQQRVAQLANACSAALRLILIALPTWQGTIELSDAIIAELAASATVLVWAVLSLLLYLSRQRHNSDSMTLLDGAMLGRMGRFAAFNYGAQILQLANGPNGLRFAVSSVLGVAASAHFGFVMSLSETVQRYLPTTLLATLIRPVLVARYVAHGGFAQINRFASVLFKVNLMVVAPALVLTITRGDLLVCLLGGDKYADARWLLPAAFALLLTMSHTVIVSLIANTLERNVLQLRGGVFSVAGLALGLALATGFGSFGVIAGAWIGTAAYNAYAVRSLRTQGFPYQVDVAGASRLFVAAALGIGITSLAANLLPPLTGLGATLIGGTALYLALLRSLKSFSESDIAVLRNVVPARLTPLLNILRQPQ